MLNGWDQATVVVIVLYFMYWSKNWFPLFLGLTVLGAVCQCYMLVCVPESPKWLLTQKRRKDAIAALNRIAEANRSKNRIPLDAQFEELTSGRNDDSSH